MKKCTVCLTYKEDDGFYFDAATARLMSKCKVCASRFVVLSKQYKRQGKKLTTKEFREQELYKV